MTECPEMSIHEVKVFLVLNASPSNWLTTREIGERLEGVTARTIRAHVLKLVKLGLVAQSSLFPAYKYRLAPHAGKRNCAYRRRLHEAAEMFGLSK